MLENYRGLASYFDEGPHASKNWHDQTQMGEALSAYQDVDGHAKPVWVPDGKQPSQKPGNMQFHERGAGPFKPDQWGYDASKAAAATARYEKRMQEKGHKKKRGQETEKKHRRPRSEKIKYHGELMAKQEKIASQKWHDNHAFDTGPTGDNLVAIMNMAERNLQDCKISKKHYIAQIKDQNPIQDSSDKHLKRDQHNKRNAEIHSFAYGFFESAGFKMYSLVPWQQHLNTINSICTNTGTPNVLGTNLPQNAGRDIYFMSVAQAFFAKIKRQIMTISLAMVQAKLSKTADENAFVSASTKAEKHLEKIISLKKYNQKRPAYADSAALQDWHEQYLQREIAAFQAQHTNKQLPYYLKHQMKPPPGWTPQPRKPRPAKPANQPAAAMHGYYF